MRPRIRKNVVGVEEVDQSEKYLCFVCEEEISELVDFYEEFEIDPYSKRTDRLRRW